MQTTPVIPSVLQFSEFCNGSAATDVPTKRTTQPIVTGTSVLGIKFNGGIAIAADTLGSYGSMAMYRNIRRIVKVGKHTLVAGSGDFSDFQTIARTLDQLASEDQCRDDGRRYTSKEIYNYLSAIFYNRRNKMDPLWNNLIIGGFDDDSLFLGQVDLLGTSFEDDTLATGYGSYIARPLLREAFRPDLTKEEATKILIECMTVLYYRDARAHNYIQIATVTADEVNVTDPFEIETNWAVGENPGEVYL